MAGADNLAAKMDVDEAAIDEGLYSRQLWVLAPSCVARMADLYIITQLCSRA